MYLEVTRSEDNENILVSRLSIVYVEENGTGSCLNLTPSYGHLDDNMRKFDHEKIYVTESYESVKTLLMTDTVLLQV